MAHPIQTEYAPNVQPTWENVSEQLILGQKGTDFAAAASFSLPDEIWENKRLCLRDSVAR